MTSEQLQAAFKYLFVEELAALKQLAQSLPSNPIVVNIGAGSGTSGLAFLESRDDLQLYTIDIQYEDSPFGCIAAEHREIEKAGYNTGRYRSICGDSKQFGKLWKDVVVTPGFERAYPDVDLVFIDGDHSYLGAKGDILAWLPNIKPGGIMAVHDFGKCEVYKNGPIDNAPHPLPWRGVDRAVRKFLCPKYEMILHVKTLVAFRVSG